MAGGRSRVTAWAGAGGQRRDDAGSAAPARLWEKVLNLLGFGDDEEPEGLEPPRGGARHAAESSPGRPGRNVVALSGGRPATQGMFITISRPRSIDEARAAAEQIRAGRPVVLNLQEVDREAGRRILDFIGGAIYAVGGEMHLIGPGVILMAPGNVTVIWERGEPA